MKRSQALQQAQAERIKNLEQQQQSLRRERDSSLEEVESIKGQIADAAKASPGR